MNTINNKLVEYQRYKSILHGSEMQMIESVKKNLQEIDYELFKEIVYPELEEYVEFNGDDLYLLGLEITEYKDFGLCYLNNDCDKLIIKIIDGKNSEEKYNEYLEKISKS